MKTGLSPDLKMGSTLKGVCVCVCGGGGGGGRKFFSLPVDIFSDRETKPLFRGGGGGCAEKQTGSNKNSACQKWWEMYKCIQSPFTGLISLRKKELIMKTTNHLPISKKNIHHALVNNVNLD